MKKITKEDWDFIFNTDDPDYEKKFNELVKKYIEKTEKDISKVKDIEEKRDWTSKLNSFKYYFKYENWITILPTYKKIVLTEKDRKRVIIERGRAFSNCWDILRNDR